MPKVRVRPAQIARLSRCCDIIDQRLSRQAWPDARVERDWWRRPLNVLSARLRWLDGHEAALAKQTGSPALDRDLAEVRAARLALYTMAIRVERMRHFADYAEAGVITDTGILNDLEEALLSASWGTGNARERLRAPSPLSSVPNPSALELRAKLIAALETLPADRAPSVYAAADRAGLPKSVARAYMNNYRNQSPKGPTTRMRGNDVLFTRRDHWKGVLADLTHEGLDLDTFFRAL